MSIVEDFLLCLRHRVVVVLVVEFLVDNAMIGHLCGNMVQASTEKGLPHLRRSPRRCCPNIRLVPFQSAERPVAGLMRVEAVTAQTTMEHQGLTERITNGADCIGGIILQLRQEKKGVQIIITFCLHRPLHLRVEISFLPSRSPLVFRKRGLSQIRTCVTNLLPQVILRNFDLRLVQTTQIPIRIPLAGHRNHGLLTLHFRTAMVVGRIT
mmetsp:Transcript_19519/g.44434  ORF Transcript_19519/g.44434 Transcript_19519/m.44434 type:complete len:210 (-) Transcript_19519:269-898(-)